MSFYTALTGLNAASKELSVTANNIANSSTTGFKKSTVSFGDIYASSPFQQRNTVVGQGVAIKDVNQQFTQGFIEFSSNALDLAITGEGFFPLKNEDGADVYSRSGIFMVDQQNRVVNDAGQLLQAVPVDSAGRADFSRATGTLTIPPVTSGESEITSIVELAINLPADAEELGATTAPDYLELDINDPTTFNESTTVRVFDESGNERSLSLYYRLATAADPIAGADSVWEVHAYLDGERASGTAGGVAIDNPQTLNFNNAGGVTSGAFAFGDILGGALTVDVTSSTQIGSAFELVSQNVDGRGEGELLGIDINDQGLVSASYSNGAQVALGKIALANFDIPSGLRQLGNSTFAATADSGNATISEAGSSGFGTIRAGALERSNVDLTEELVSMINSQRKFQANAKAIETNSTLAQTIINLRS